MTTPNKQIGFPQVRLDQMAAKAAAFDPRASFEVPAGWSFGGSIFHRDAAETAYVIRSLEDIRAGVLEQEFPQLMAQQWFPFSIGGIDPGAESVTIRHANQKGKVEFTKDLMGDAPRVDFDMDEVSYPLRSFWVSYGFGIQDVRAAMKAGVPLQSKTASLAREQMARKLDDIAFNGDTPAGLKGILTLSGTSTYTVPTTGVGASKTWASKSPDDVLLDLAAPASQVIAATLGIENPDSMLMPISLYELINSRRVGDGTSESILSYFRRNDSNIRNIYRSHKGATAGAASTTRVVTYEKSSAKLEMLVPIVFEQFAPGVSANGLVVQTVCHMRTGGMIAHRPGSIVCSDGQ